jgi:hypothetical protein
MRYSWLLVSRWVAQPLLWYNGVDKIKRDALPHWLNHIYSKLDVHGRTQAIAKARGSGLLEEPTDDSHSF